MRSNCSIELCGIQIGKIFHIVYENHFLFFEFIITIIQSENGIIEFYSRKNSIAN